MRAPGSKAAKATKNECRLGGGIVSNTIDPCRSYGDGR